MKMLFSVLLILLASGSVSTITLGRTVQRLLYNPRPLILEGHVKKLEKDSEDSHFFTLKATLILTFKNVGSKPLIIYRNDLWLGGIRLSRTIEDAGAYKFIYDSSAWPSNWGRESQYKLRKVLDQPRPPADVTLILQPGELWQYETVTHLGIDKKEGPSAHGLTWDEIKISPRVWLFVTFEMWPVNAEPRLDPDNPAFGLMLRDRWKGSGELWLDYLTSQPIAFDLNDLQETRRTVAPHNAF
jgi:hypothetical protein